MQHNKKTKRPCNTTKRQKDHATQQKDKKTIKTQTIKLRTDHEVLKMFVEFK